MENAKRDQPMLSRLTALAATLTVGAAVAFLITACARSPEVSNCDSNGITLEQAGRTQGLLSCAGVIPARPTAFRLKPGESVVLAGPRASLLTLTPTTAILRLQGNTLTAEAPGESQIEATATGTDGSLCGDGAPRCVLLTVTVS